jgi:hypothetical protein
MYEATFKDVGFRLPFSPFQISVLEWLEVCPSQLRPDCFAYMMAFESVCRFLQLIVFKDLFFTIFTVRRNVGKDGGFNWVSFHQRIALFEAFGSGVTRFHERFFLIRPKTEAAIISVLKVVERSGEGVGGVSTRVPHFPFCWSRDHLRHEPSMYRRDYDRLIDRDQTSLARIIEFVRSFSLSEVVAEDGSPVLDSRGNLVTKPHLIDTQSLVSSKDSLALLGMLVLLCPSLSSCLLEFSD